MLHLVKATSWCLLFLLPAVLSLSRVLPKSSLNRVFRGKSDLLEWQQLTVNESEGGAVTYILLQPEQCFHLGPRSFVCLYFIHSYHSYYFNTKKKKKEKKKVKKSVKPSRNQKLHEIVTYPRKFVCGLGTMQFPWLKTFQAKEKNINLAISFANERYDQ